MDSPTNEKPNVVADPAGNSSDDVSKLRDTQVFARDPEDYTAELTADTVSRLSKILARQRKARQDDAEVAALAAKFKKSNAAAKRKKAKLASGGDIMEEIV